MLLKGDILINCLCLSFKTHNINKKIKVAFPLFFEDQIAGILVTHCLVSILEEKTLDYIYDQYQYL